MQRLSTFSRSIIQNSTLGISCLSQPRYSEYVTHNQVQGILSLQTNQYLHYSTSLKSELNVDEITSQHNEHNFFIEQRNKNPSKPSLHEQQLKALSLLNEPERGLFQEIFYRYKTRKIKLSKIGDLIYHSVVMQAERDELWNLLGSDKGEFEVIFRTWFAVTTLHMWMVIARLRFEPIGRDLQKSLQASFWRDVEARILGAGLTNPIVWSKESRRHSSNYLGFLVGYDEAVLSSKGDAMLADALWRNIYAMKPVSAVTLSKLVTYVRKQMAALDKQDIRLTLIGETSWDKID